MFVARNQKKLKRIGSFFLSKITIGHMLRRNSVWSGGPENAFNTKKQLSSHIHQYHKNNKDCDQCSKSFSTSTNRIAHEATHSNMFECQSCDKIYTNKTSYKKHVKNCAGSKTPVESFHCNDCDKTFSRNSHLTRHMVSSLIHNNVINQS